MTQPFPATKISFFPFASFFYPSRHPSMRSGITQQFLFLSKANRTFHVILCAFLSRYSYHLLSLSIAQKPEVLKRVSHHHHNIDWVSDSLFPIMVEAQVVRNPFFGWAKSTSLRRVVLSITRCCTTISSAWKPVCKVYTQYLRPFSFNPSGTLDCLSLCAIPPSPTYTPR
jgi:hypothetical protein